MYDPEALVEIWKMDIEAAERRATENARFRHLGSKKREMLDAALITVKTDTIWCSAVLHYRP